MSNKSAREIVSIWLYSNRDKYFPIVWFIRKKGQKCSKKNSMFKSTNNKLPLISSFISLDSFSLLLISVIICLFRFKFKSTRRLSKFLLEKVTTPTLLNPSWKKGSGFKQLKTYNKQILYGHNWNKTLFSKIKSQKNIFYAQKAHKNNHKLRKTMKLLNQVKKSLFKPHWILK